MTDAELPIGRRMAQLRSRRSTSQHVFADRISRSKSWVDKVKRGLRTLNRLSVIETVAEVLGVAPDVLLARKVRREPVGGVGEAVDRVRAALACYDNHGARAGDVTPAATEKLDRRVRGAGPTAADVTRLATTIGLVRP